MENKLHLTSLCWLEDVPYMGVTLCYLERSPDPWYSDSQTDVDIDKATAEKIIAFLEKYIK